MNLQDLKITPDSILAITKNMQSKKHPKQALDDMMQINFIDIVKQMTIIAALTNIKINLNGDVNFSTHQAFKQAADKVYYKVLIVVAKGNMTHMAKIAQVGRSYLYIKIYQFDLMDFKAEVKDACAARNKGRFSDLLKRTIHENHTSGSKGRDSCP